MFRFPLVIVCMIVAFNLTAFTLLLQFDFLIFNAIYWKIIFWILSAGAWVLSYKYRDKFVTLF